MYYRWSGAADVSGELAVTVGQPEVPELLAVRSDSPQTANSADLLTETGAASRETLIRSLALSLAGHGSSRRVMVGTTGFEPATP